MNFNLQNPSFSQSDDDDQDLLVPSNDMINQYNREYSMIVGEVQRFLKEIKESVQRFVAYNNFGANLNLPGLLSNILSIDQFFKNKLQHAEQHGQGDSKTASRLKYETSFNRLLQKMGDLLKDFLDCELEFKKEYFGLKAQRDFQRGRNNLRTRTLSPNNYSISSITNSSKSTKLHMQQYLQQEQKEEKREAELRATLNERLKPKAAAVEIECKGEYSTTENLYRLNEKIERMFEGMRTIRTREQKLIELFNLNRGKKVQPHQQQPVFPSTDVSRIQLSSENQQLDSFLEQCRPCRKDDDTITEQGHHPKSKTFIKRSPTLVDLIQ